MSKYPVTTDEARDLLQLTNAYDTVMDALIPIVTAEVMSYCNTHFPCKDIEYLASDLVFADKTITTDDETDFSDIDFYAEDIIYISNSARNDGLQELETVALNVLTTADDLKAEESEREILIEKVEYPQSLKLSVIDIIKFYLNKNRDKASVSLGDYSFGVSSTDWPESIRRSLNRHRKLY